MVFKVGNTVEDEGVHGQEDGNREVRQRVAQIREPAWQAVPHDLDGVSVSDTGKMGWWKRHQVR
jgi:hypothetical protein